MYTQIIKSSMQSQKRTIASGVKKLAVESRYRSKSSPSTFKPKQNIEPGVYYQPSPSIPTPLQKTPNAFLPKSDPRKASVSEYTKEDISYMPPLTEPKEKKYHLTAEQAEEIKQLRQSDPYKYTRKVLAEKFQCSEFFIGLVADNTEARTQDMDNRLETIKSLWSENKKNARLDRKKRQQSWYRNA